MANIKPRLEYDATDTAVDRLQGGSTALHVLTQQNVDLTILLTADQVEQLRRQIDAPPAS